MRFFFALSRMTSIKIYIHMSVCCKNSYISIFHTIKPEDFDEEYHIETNEYKEEDEELNTMIKTEITKNTKPEEEQVDNQSIKGIMI